MAEINGWRVLQNLAERKTGRIVVSVAERWRCCSKPVTGHLWFNAALASRGCFVPFRFPENGLNI